MTLTPLRACIALCLVGLLCLAAGVARADDGSYFVFDSLTFGGVTIDFDTDAAGQPIAASTLFEEATPLRDQYAALGVHFRGPGPEDGGCILHRNSSFQVDPVSGSNFLAFNREAATATAGFAREPETITFDAPVRNVSIYAAGGFKPDTFRLDAYDRAGALVATSSVTAQSFQKLEVTAPAIARVVLSRQGPRAQVTASLGDVTGAPGDTVSVPLRVDAAAHGLVGLYATITLPGALTVGDPPQVAAGGLMAGGAGAGVLKVAAARGTGADGPGAVLTLTARIAANAQPGTYPLTLSDVRLNDGDGQTFAAAVLPGTLTVTSPTTAQPTFAATVTATPTTVAPGQDVTISLNVTVRDSAFTGIVDVEVYTGAGVKVGQQFWQGESFTAGQSRSYTYDWKAPAQEGTYAVDVGIFTPGFEQNPYWKEGLATITVKAPPPTQPGFTSTTTATPSTVAPGGTVLITSSFTVNGQTFSGIADIEVYGPAGARVAQQFWEGQSFSGGQTRTYTYQWTAPAQEGTYTVDVGLFTPGWSGNPYWKEPAATITVKAGGTPGATWGDMNGDGRLSVSDAAIALRIAVGLATPTSAQTEAARGAPFNISLAVRILRVALGLAPPP